MENWNENKREYNSSLFFFRCLSFKKSYRNHYIVSNKHEKKEKAHTEEKKKKKIRKLIFLNWCENAIKVNFQRHQKVNLREMNIIKIDYFSIWLFVKCSEKSTIYWQNKFFFILSFLLYFYFKISQIENDLWLEFFSFPPPFSILFRLSNNEKVCVHEQEIKTLNVLFFSLFKIPIKLQ